MSFILVSWSNEDDITEVKLDQMILNDAHVRNEADFKTVVLDGHEEISSASNSGFRLWIDGSAIGSGVTADPGNGPFELYETNIDISAYSESIHELVVAGPSGLSKFRFIKTPDMEYLSYFVTLGRRAFDGETETYSRDLTVIGHKDTQSWIA